MTTQKQDFLTRLDNSQFSGIFDEIPGIYFFAKDCEGFFVMANSATLQLFGFNSEESIIGKTDFDIASSEIASQYLEADKKVIESGNPMRNIIEPVPDNEGILRWHSTHKLPLFDSDKKVIGVAVIMRDISSVSSLGPFQEMAEVVDYIFQNYHQQILIDDLAEIAGLSSRQLERRFKKLLGLTPIRYINEHRIRMACSKLRQSQKNIAEIAKEVGFYDHAHFVHKFRSSMKIAPSEYRAKY